MSCYRNSVQHFLTICLVSSVLSDSFQQLPKLFELEDFGKCEGEENEYCEVTIKLKPVQNDTKIWRAIESSVRNKFRFGRDYLYRGICLAKESKELELYVNNINKNLNKFKIKAELDNVKCKNTFLLFSTEDYLFCLSIFCYCFFIIYATRYDYLRRKKQCEGNKYLVAFSLISNFEKTTKPFNNVNYKKLKPIQALRTYSMMLIVAGHSFMNYSLGFIANPEFLENIVSSKLEPFFNFFMFIVQPFFLFSGWLLAVQIHEIYENNGRFTFVRMIQHFLNRVVRLWPTLIVCVLLNRSNFCLWYLNGSVFYLVRNNWQCCMDRWWSTIFFFTNYYEPKYMCNIASWYLGADTQMFLISLIILYVLYKFNLPFLRSLMIILFVYIAAQAFVLYNNAIDVIYRVSVDNFFLPSVFKEYKTDAMLWYFSTTSNASTYILGVLFGTIYYKNKNNNFFQTNAAKRFWNLSFVGLPLMVSILTTYQFNRLNSAILGAIVKPIFALGVGIGVLGMAQNIGGILQRICEWRPAEVLSHCTYSVYLYHTAVVFEGILTTKTLLYGTYYQMISNSFLNVIKCFLLGFLLTLGVEYPFGNLQSMLFKPEDKKNKKKL